MRKGLTTYKTKGATTNLTHKNLITYLLKVGASLLVLYTFIVALDVMSGGFALLGADMANQLSDATANPFIGLFIGLLFTATIQSSSTVTSMLVAIVASGMLSIEAAVPVVMGANVGTTVTSTLVALGHIDRKSEFRKAIAAAALHDIFNILTVLVLMPLEYFTGFLSHSSEQIASFIFSGDLYINRQFFFFNQMVDPVANVITGVFSAVPVILVLISLVLLIGSIKVLASLMRSVVLDDRVRKVEKIIFRNHFSSFGSGLLTTALVQSSSITSSLIVPMVATGRIEVRKAYPFLMGTNIGTTFTALIAAFTKSELAVTIALVHVLFNLVGVAFMVLPGVSASCVWMARKLGATTIRNRLYGFFYLLLIFFAIPFVLIYLSK